MATWKVVNRITGEVVHAYTSDDPAPEDCPRDGKRRVREGGMT